ncbi:MULTISPECIES: TetR/AcrR family transcriptional regulator [unclassified Pseudoalteromonas]|uniref:TetR/AcrR family transcriptional regulator n=1 Tax=unclassified Pseudoalteromonas TaxID=194690 RepID=UPI000C685049|nr:MULTISPECIES: TetR/AcrR family transcriptional regulator [unclassified Pseudoalteromonas]MAY58012.1 TetR family transcriptional regulator [Pseudoalteromonas sp.]MDN3403737.1 TetR/AcrR family transcriptional regulator [Pseudoalteromonas sp. APC 3218]MDN3407576.1 TetR/AcrR family transcriptional regulator [Pseudoalteromonas sp. APC 3894]MDN3414887.1 TetR/AcrR family transcriptional regulator [Pseudoalteromonas sp. APC 3227]MDN3418585.1 TetR/AcrR family transcriptional regulator [Pseudoalterom|tara:strand:- start:13732 stop:14253 length:522 start_codon:yes stop_codon:yes gene_type:complete
MSKKEKTRDKILASAWELFLLQGYDHTSTREIAIAANVAVGTVFSHFENKIDLLMAGMQQQIAVIINQAKQLDTQHSPRLKLRHYAHPLYSFYCENSEFSKLLISDIIWRTSLFKAQMDEFKQLLFSEQPKFDETKASVMMDCYFMTLVDGLNDPLPNAENMLRQLSNKIALL